MNRYYAERAERATRSIGTGLLATVLVTIATVSACSKQHMTRKSTPVIAPVTLRWIAAAEDEEKLRHHNRARLLYLRAKRESPDDVSRSHATREYALTLISWGELLPAQRQLEEATRLRPEDPRNWHDLGHVANKLGEPRRAEQALRTAIRLGHDPRSHLSLAALLVDQRRFDDAITEFETLRKMRLPARVRQKIDEYLPTLRAHARAAKSRTNSSEPGRRPRAKPQRAKVQPGAQPE